MPKSMFTSTSLTLVTFPLNSNAIQLVLVQLCCHTYWPRSSLVVGKWAEVASAWPPSGQPCLPLHHPPTHQHLSWATCNFEKRKKGETKLIPMTENDICWIEIRFQGIAFNRRNKGNDRNSPLNIGRNQFEAGAPALRTFCTIGTDKRKVVSLIQVK